MNPLKISQRSHIFTGDPQAHGKLILDLKILLQKSNNVYLEENLNEKNNGLGGEQNNCTIKISIKEKSKNMPCGKTDFPNAS